MNEPYLGRQRNLWGRRQSRPLKEAQRQALTHLWPDIALDLATLGERGKSCLSQEKIDPHTLFPVSYEEIWLEIGFGSGEHLAEQAAFHPAIGFIGCEPFLNGVASLTQKIQGNSLKNIKILKDDARLLLSRMPAQSISRIFVLFPDPWPKRRHHKRRFIQAETIEAFANVLTPGGLLYLATDHQEYGEWMQDIMNRQSRFKLMMEERQDVRERPAGWPQTRYEQKGLAQGNGAVYLLYEI